MRKLKKAAVLLLTIIMAVSALSFPSSAAVSRKMWGSMFAKQYNALANTVTSDTDLMSALKENGQYIYFISVTDGSKQAQVTHIKGDKQNATLRDTALAAKSALKTAPLYMKLDIVESVTETTYAEFKETLSGKTLGWYRYGVAFDADFKTALLESELNSNGILNYETGTIDLKKLNAYLKSQGQSTLKRVPTKLYYFSCVSYFCDENNSVYELEPSYLNQGRRDVVTDKDFLKQMMGNTGTYLASTISLDDGSFDYEKHPIDGVSADDYNIVRHAGTVWNLINEYSISGDRKLLEPINKAMEYMVNRITYVDGKAYYLDDYNRTSAGGNGLAVLAFADYSRYINTTKYKKLAAALSDALIDMMNDDGSINHMYKYKNKQIVLTKAFSCVYYDGEAAFALARMYTAFGTKKYLDAACRLADYFIANNYDDASNVHWIGYSMNEITKHVGKEEYYSFGLGHIAAYMEQIGRRKSSSPAATEGLLASFEMYARMTADGINVEFDIEKLLQAIANRIDFGYNYYMLPELAMYFKNPNEIMYGFAIREDNFRMRIDDTQHFMGGYCSYYRNYTTLSKYMAVYGLNTTANAA